MSLVIAAAFFAVAFWMIAVTPYFTLQREAFGQAPDVYWPRRFPLWLHIAGGSLALLLGPVNLWLGETRRRLAWHKRLGLAYFSGVALATAAAFYLSFTTPLGVVFATGLFTLAVAWTITSGMAFRAIARRAVAQHREWMIRSYVVTLGFVFFRIAFAVMETQQIGTVTERLGLAAWGCFTLPLLITEMALQWRKVKS